MSPEQKFHLPPDLLTPMGREPDLAQQSSLDVHEEIEALKGAMHRVADRVVGREQLVQQTLLTILAREHQFIFSRTGVAKSLYARSVFGQFNAKVFPIQLSRGIPEEILFGGYDVKKFREENLLWHDTANSIVDADFAFLDELMDANDMVLRSLLEVLNERTFSKGKQVEQARLHTAIATSNYLRQTQVTEPVIDRFLFRAHLTPEMTTFEALAIDKVYGRYGDKAVKPRRPLPMDIPADLAKIVQNENPNYPISASFAVLFLKNQIIKSYVQLATEKSKKHDPKAEEVYISPRTLARSRDALNASALLHHRFEITPEDLTALRFVLATISGNQKVTEGEEEDIFFQAVDDTLASYSASDLRKVEELMTINEFIEAFHRGEKVEAIRSTRLSLLKRFLEIIGVLSWREVTQEKFKNALRSIDSQHPSIAELREEILVKIEQNE